MLIDLTKYIMGEWNKFFPGVDRPKNIRYLCLAGSVEGGTTTFLALNSKDRQPAFVVKIHRDPNARDRVFSENEILNYIHENEGILSASVPRMICCRKIAGTWALVQSLIDGQPMTVPVNNRAPDLDYTAFNFRLASDWLIELYSATQSNKPDITDSLSKTALTTLEEFSGIFDLSVQEQDILKIIADNITSAATNGVCLQHSDFCRQNVLLLKSDNKASIGVLDWTDSKFFGFPLYDLFYFLTSYSLQARTGSGIDSITDTFEYSFFKANPYNRIIMNTIVDFCSSTSIDMSSIKILFGMFLVERAMFEYKRLQRVSQYGYLPRFNYHLILNENCDYQGALKQQLFVRLFHVFANQQVQSNEKSLFAFA